MNDLFIYLNIQTINQMFNRLAYQIYNILHMVTTARKRRSEKVPQDLLKTLRKYVNDQPTFTDAAESLEVSRLTLRSILKGGTAATDTIEKLRDKLNA